MNKTTNINLSGLPGRGNWLPDFAGFKSEMASGLTHETEVLCFWWVQSFLKSE